MTIITYTCTCTILSYNLYSTYLCCPMGYNLKCSVSQTVSYHVSQTVMLLTQMSYHGLCTRSNQTIAILLITWSEKITLKCSGNVSRNIMQLNLSKCGWGDGEGRGGGGGRFLTLWLGSSGSNCSFSSMPSRLPEIALLIWGPISCSVRRPACKTINQKSKKIQKISRGGIKSFLKENVYSWYTSTTEMQIYGKWIIICSYWELFFININLVDYMDIRNYVSTQHINIFYLSYSWILCYNFL